MRIALPLTALSRRPARLSLRSAIALWRSRRALTALSNDQLSDIGLSRDDAQSEAARPVWDAPASWMD